MKIWTVDFTPVYPMPSGLIIAAPTEAAAMKLAKETCTHTGIISITEVDISKSCVIHYESGDY